MRIAVKTLFSTLFMFSILNVKAQTIEGVKFTDYPAKISSAPKAKIDYASNSLGKLFKTAITEGYNESEVNFGGHYICTFWGAGQGSTGGAVVDILTGKIYKLPLTEDNSYRQVYYNDNKNIFHSANSTLLVTYRNEPNTKDENKVNLYYYYYQWDEKGKKFNLIKKKNVTVSSESTIAFTPAKVPAAAATATGIPTVTLNQKGEITVSGKSVSLENLRKEVQNALVKLPTVPDEVPIKFEGETGMGMRAEVRTEVADAIAGAKWLKKSKATIAAKSVSTKAAIPSVTLNRKGEITLSGKKVELENLKKELQGELLKQTAIPNKIDLKTIGETGMGMRSEVHTEINQAIKGAKWLRKKTALEAISKELNLETALQVQEYKTNGEYTFLIVKAPSKTATGTNEAGLLKLENGAWKVVTHVSISKDVPYACWWKQYNVSKELFNKKSISSKCE